MRKQLLFLICVGFAAYAHAQKLEIFADADAGLFRYAGVSTTTNTVLIQNSTDNKYYTNNPYGSQNDISYGFGMSAKYVTESGFIAGLGAGYEVSQAKTTITSVYSYMIYFSLANYNILLSNVATGESHLKNTYINLNPFIGYRVKFKKVSLDILPGLDIGFNTSSYDKGHATQNDAQYEAANNLTAAVPDIRLRLGLAALYKRFGITASGARGLTNYEKNNVGDGNYNAESRLLRLGVTYRIY